MEGTGSIEEHFGGEARQFRVALGELRKIQIKCEAGPATIAGRLARCAQVLRQMPKATALELALTGLGDWRVDDIREPIFHGLMGGGMSPNDAGKLVAEWIDKRGFRGLIENAELALALVIAGVAQPEDDQVGEPAAGTTKAKRTRKTKSPSPTSTAPAQP